ncbi:Protein fem-1-like protein [Colletotrichum chlorophyti]|uniref:Protein fem-1-like protein n=1 Tax=Colletotrichum chlorophyti TaxID=708187 RepID=A0A1Q8RQZ2_9PEZI|nr:Protein fem-1-like protein [Colletotrichum chlorophyti]
MAASRGEMDTLKELAQLRRLDLDQSDIDGPLYNAVVQGCEDRVRILLDAGEDVNETGKSILRGRSPLQMAVEDGDIAIIDMLLAAGADVNTPAADEYGATALQLAAINGSLGIARTLIEAGADVNAPRAMVKGRTALEGAAEHGRIDMIQLLLNQGVQSTGVGRLQYLRAVKFAEAEAHMVAASMLRSHRKWETVDLDLWSQLDRRKDWDNLSEEDFGREETIIGRGGQTELSDSVPNYPMEKDVQELQTVEGAIVRNAHWDLTGNGDWPMLESLEAMTNSYSEYFQVTGM